MGTTGNLLRVAQRRTHNTTMTITGHKFAQIQLCDNVLSQWHSHRVQKTKSSSSETLRRWINGTVVTTIKSNCHDALLRMSHPTDRRKDRKEGNCQRLFQSHQLDSIQTLAYQHLATIPHLYLSVGKESSNPTARRWSPVGTRASGF